MEEKFIALWLENRRKAEGKGVRLRPIDPKDAMAQARRSLSGSRCSDGFDALASKGLLQWSLEALVIDRRFTALFSDDEANNALLRLLDAGYQFKKITIGRRNP